MVNSILMILLIIAYSVIMPVRHFWAFVSFICDKVFSPGKYHFLPVSTKIMRLSEPLVRLLLAPKELQAVFIHETIDLSLKQICYTGVIFSQGKKLIFNEFWFSGIIVPRYSFFWDPRSLSDALIERLLDNQT